MAICERGSISIPGQREDEWPSDYIERVVKGLRDQGVTSAVVGLRPGYEGNRVLVMYPSGAACLDQDPKEPFSEYCARIKEVMQGKGGSGSFNVFDRMREHGQEIIIV